MPCLAVLFTPTPTGAQEPSEYSMTDPNKLPPLRWSDQINDGFYGISIDRLQVLVADAEMACRERAGKGDSNTWLKQFAKAHDYTIDEYLVLTGLCISYKQGVIDTEERR